MKTDLARALQAQVDKPGVINANGPAIVYFNSKKLIPARRQPRKYKPLSDSQAIARLRKDDYGRKRKGRKPDPRTLKEAYDQVVARENLNRYPALTALEA